MKGGPDRYKRPCELSIPDAIGDRASVRGLCGLLYYPSPRFDQVSTAQADFLLRRL